MRRQITRLVAMMTGVLAAAALLVAPPASAAPGGRFALVIGVGDFMGRTARNPGSAGDARDFHQFFAQKGFQTRVLIDEQATAPAVREGLDWLVSNCGPGTDCAFHYSGHVKQLMANDGDLESLDENIWTYENAFIADGDIAQKLSQIRGNAWFDFSGCEGAGFDDNLSSSNRLVTASSQEDEKSYESHEWQNSIWTELLLNQGLRGGSTFDQAFASASAQAPIVTASQPKGPQHPYRAGGSGTSWLDGSAAPATLPAPKSCLLGLICL